MTDTQVEKPKLLLVDDTPANLKAMRTLLAKVDAEIVEASSGNEALALTLQQEFALILLDVQMPEMDGYEVATLLREEDSTKHVPIIFVTAVHRGEEHKLQAYQAGAVDFIEKPINKHILLAKVQIFLDLHSINIKLKELEQNTRATLETISDPILVVQLNEVIFTNESAAIFGKSCVVNTKVCTLDDVFGFDSNNLSHIKQLINQATTSSKRLGSPHEFVFSPNETSEKQTYELRVTALPESGAGGKKAVLVFHDISESRSLSEQLAYQAQHDSLTGLPNRRYFDTAFNSALARSKRHAKTLGVFLIDLDNFKQVNDTLGHFAGDQILEEASTRIRSCLRDEDVLARFGGDEFCVLLEDFDAIEDILIPAQRINDALSRKFLINGQERKLGASIGITSTLQPGDRDSAAMLGDADLAMYQAKSAGRGCYKLFSPEMREKVQKRIGLENEFERALENGEFQLYYQPQLNVKGGKLIGLEALIRWNHPKQGLMPPAEFLPELESSEFMGPVGQWVIEEACRQLSEWRKNNYQLPRVSVNVSPNQFDNESFPDFVSQALTHHSIESQYLGIEITETLFMEHTSCIEKNMKRISRMGCKISLDDFGTGYSSLSYLIRFPVDVIKIDQVFIRGLLSNPQYRILIASVIGMAEGFNDMRVIAEGVEEESQLNTLKELGCDAYQGYLYSKPVPAEDIEPMLRKEL